MCLKRVVSDEKPIMLEGFNNLTKSLSFNLYDFCVARDDYERKTYVRYIQHRYHAASITRVLKGVCEIIKANVLAVSDQDYDPWGASSLLLMSDMGSGSNCTMHLDKSHICAHTYPDFRHKGVICSFRIDIEISTCGEISPLKALNYMFETFDFDVAVVDYKVRGYTRDGQDRRIYLDHEMRTISDHIHEDILADYYCEDFVLKAANIWQIKMLRRNLDRQSYFLNPASFDDKEMTGYLDRVKQEMRGLLYMSSD